MIRRLLLLGAAAGVLSSCATVASWNEGCAGVYSGVKYNRAIADTHLVALDEAPLQWIIHKFDLPASALLDTALLPITVFLDPEPRPSGAPGCCWAAEGEGAEHEEAEHETADDEPAEHDHDTAG